MWAKHARLGGVGEVVSYLRGKGDTASLWIGGGRNQVQYGGERGDGGGMYASLGVP